MELDRQPAPRAEADEEADCVRRAAAGCDDSFARLVMKHQDRLLRFLVQRGCGHHDAEEICQEALVKAYRNLRRFDPRWRFSTWLFTIAQRELISRQRSRRRPMVELDNATTAATRAVEADSGENGEPPGIWKVVRSVAGAESYAAMWLFYAEDMTVKEIARVLGRSGIWVRVNMHRARKALQAELLRRKAAGWEP